MRFWLVMVLGALLTAGCRPGDAQRNSGPAARGPKSPTRMTPDQRLTGRVAMVNPQNRTAILSFPIGWVPAAGRQLGVYREGLKVGEVRITGPQMDTNIAADLLAGEAAAGDMVREN